MRILVTGGRDFTNIDVVRQALSQIEDEYNRILPPPTLVHGGARGADSLTAQVAGNERCWRLEAHPALWEKWGKSAGFRRNQEMVDSGADLCLAFPGGRGTMHCVQCAEEAGIPIRRIA